MESKWGPRAFLRAYQDEVRFGSASGAILRSKWRPSWTHVGDIFGTCRELFEFPRRSLKEVRFQDDFEAIWERLGGAKTSISYWRGCKNRLLEDVDFGRPLGAIWEAKVEAKMEPK